MLLTIGRFEYIVFDLLEIKLCLTRTRFACASNILLTGMSYEIQNNEFVTYFYINTCRCDQYSSFGDMNTNQTNNAVEV